MEWLNALLDLVDAVSTAVGWVAFWFAWVAPSPSHPRPPPAPPGDADAVERFLDVATVGRRCADRASDDVASNDAAPAPGEPTCESSARRFP